MSAVTTTPERAWFLTLSGQQFFYDEPGAYPFNVEEIAHALSFDCRFGCHLQHFYSVAQHAVLVARTVHWLGMTDPRVLRAALLHDASEAYLRDIPSPMKRLPAMYEYRILERRVQEAILSHFGIEDLIDHPAIHRADKMMLETEKRALRPPSKFRQDYENRESSPVFVAPMPPEEARELFVIAWSGYGG